MNRALGVAASTLTMLLFAACSHQPPQPTSSHVNTGFLAAQHATKLVGAPYRYGGNTPGGFDCSGLVQYSYARAGVAVPRTTRLQRRRSRRIDREQIRAGDLLFFDQAGKPSSHVALYIGSNRFVHAPSTGKRVHISTLTHPYWRRHLVEARRFDFD